jgi:hypothetical protein
VKRRVGVKVKEREARCRCLDQRRGRAQRREAVDVGEKSVSWRCRRAKRQSGGQQPAVRAAVSGRWYATDGGCTRSRRREGAIGASPGLSAREIGRRVATVSGPPRGRSRLARLWGEIKMAARQPLAGRLPACTGTRASSLSIRCAAHVQQSSALASAPTAVCLVLRARTGAQRYDAIRCGTIQSHP